MREYISTREKRKKKMNWGWEKNKKRRKRSQWEKNRKERRGEQGGDEEEEEMKIKRQPEQKEAPLGRCHRLFIESRTAPYPVPARSDRRPA